MMKKEILIFSILLLITFLSSCTVRTDQDGLVSALEATDIATAPAVLQTVTDTSTPVVNTVVPIFVLDIPEFIPAVFGFKAAEITGTEPLSLDLCGQHDQALWYGEYILSVAAAFPTVTDDISYDEIERIWHGTEDHLAYFQTLLIAAELEPLLRELWGEPDSSNVRYVPIEEMAVRLWEFPDQLAIVPFEQVKPTMKILSVAGQNPMRNSFSATQYPLSISFCLTSDGAGTVSGNLEQIPVTNRDPEKMTTLLMTGVTALTREIAYKMEIEGFLTPAEHIKPWFDEVDFVHISNEVPFTVLCPETSPPFSRSRFCSRPEYFELLDWIGADVVELTGNHLFDYGEEAFEETLGLLQANELRYFGGGNDSSEAAAPLLIEHHGNQLAFLGCNVPGPVSVFASQTESGVNQCDIDALVNQIQDLGEQGYLVIVGIQHYEACQMQPMSAQRADFLALAEAGAVIVSGSQAHCPQGMTFAGDSFLHYGLGNLFFDQMWDVYRNAFLDYHVFYDGQYLGVQLLTTRLENASQPRMMTEEERRIFLDEIFIASEWGLK